MDELERVDPSLFQLIRAELARERGVLDMVASENIAPIAVLEAQGSILTNKYADGYPEARLYDGCEVIDEIELLAIDRAKELFGAGHANVQPYSGTSANAAALRAFAQPGDAILGFAFDQGGHPSQYDSATPAGHLYEGHSYGVDRATGLLDFDQIREIALRVRPRVIFAGGSCYPRAIPFVRFREICDEVGAYLVADIAHLAGLIAAGRHESPVELADACTLTVHKTLGGARGGMILSRAMHAEVIDAAVFPGSQGGPITASFAAKAVTLHLCATPEFKERIDRTLTGARILAHHFAAAERDTRLHLVAGGTDTHLFALDTFDAGLTGQHALSWCHFLGVMGNAMTIPFDRATPPDCSGLRLGTAALATRGFRDADFAELADVLVTRFIDPSGPTLLALRERTRELARRFPIYPDLVL